MSKLKYVGLATGAALTGSYVNYKYEDSQRQPLGVKGLHHPEVLVGGVNVIPLAKTLLGLLPQSLRTHLLLSANAPAPDHVPQDTWDRYKVSPYTVEKIKNKVWRVEYERENHMITKKFYRDAAYGVLGLDMTSESNAARVMQGAEQYGREVSAMAHQDIARMKTLDPEQPSPNTHHHRENMVVVQLDSGALLLFCPVKIHDDTEFGQWLGDLGPVEYIVAPSSEHNLQLPAVIKKYPGAKVIGTSFNERKLNMVAALPRGRLDYDYTKPEDLEALSSILKPEGVNMIHIAGDVCTNALFCVAHGVALECDIVYTHADGQGFLMMDQTQLRALEPDQFTERIFKFRLLSKPNSPNGFLPPYRYWSMDPHTLWTMLPCPPAQDGSSASTMAASLRHALAQPFDSAVGVHFRHMTGDDFRKAVDSNWNWLDGNSLLPK